MADKRDNVVLLPGCSLPDGDEPSSQAVSQSVLENAVAEKIISAVVIGIDEEGQLYLASASPTMSDVHLLLSRAQSRILDVAEGFGSVEPVEED